MYSVQQLQGIDYILQRMLQNPDHKYLYKKNLQFVVDIDGKLWRGRFVITNDTSAAVTQSEHKLNGSIDIKSYNIATSPLLKKAFDAYSKTLPTDNHGTNIYYDMEELHVLFIYLSQMINDITINKSTDLNFYPYLYNAVSLDGTINLPFLEIANKEIDVVSIIDVEA